MSVSNKDESRSRGKLKSFSLRFKRNSTKGITKSQSCRSPRHEQRDTYSNITADPSGCNIVLDDSNDISRHMNPSQTRIAPKHATLGWARLKFSQFRNSIMKRNIETLAEHDSENNEQDDAAGTYSTAEECHLSDRIEPDTAVYSLQINEDRNLGHADVNHASPRLQRIAQRFFILRWMTSKFLQFRDRNSKIPRMTRSVYEKAREIEASDDSSMTSSNAEPVYMDPDLNYVDGSNQKSDLEEDRKSNQYFELEPEQRYETVTLDNASRPVLSAAVNLAPNQYAKLGEHNKQNGCNIYGDLSSLSPR